MGKAQGEKRRREPLQNFVSFQNDATTCLPGVSGNEGHIYLYLQDCGSPRASYSMLRCLCLAEEEIGVQRVGTACPGSYTVAITSLSPHLGGSQEPLSLIHSQHIKSTHSLDVSPPPQAPSKSLPCQPEVVLMLDTTRLSLSFQLQL